MKTLPPADSLHSCEQDGTAHFDTANIVDPTSRAFECKEVCTNSNGVRAINPRKPVRS